MSAGRASRDNVSSCSQGGNSAKNANSGKLAKIEDIVQSRSQDQCAAIKALSLTDAGNLKNDRKKSDASIPTNTEPSSTSYWLQRAGLTRWNELEYQDGNNAMKVLMQAEQIAVLKAISRRGGGCQKYQRLRQGGGAE